MPAPIPPELWERLSRLDARCDMELRRTDTAPAGDMHASGRNYPRMWTVRVWDRRMGPACGIVVEAASLAMALDAAARMAESRGWADLVPVIGSRT